MENQNAKTESQNNKLYLDEVEIEMPNGQKELVTKHRVGYTEGSTIHYWTNMSDSKLVNAASKEVSEMKGLVFIPIGYCFFWGYYFPSAKKDKKTKEFIKNDDDSFIYEELTAKSLLTLYGFIANKDGEPNDYNNLVSIDFKTFTASKLLNALDLKDGSFDNGLLTSLSRIRIKFIDTVKNEKVTEANEWLFELSVSNNFSFERMINQWLNDYEGSIYNQAQIDAIMTFNSRYTIKNLKLSKGRNSKKFLTPYLIKNLSFENPYDKNENGYFLKNSQSSSNLLLNATNSEDEDDTENLLSID